MTPIAASHFIDDDTRSMPVGLVQNDPDGLEFECGTCDFFDKGKCRNKNPDLNGRDVGEEWCCNLYKHPGMKVIVR